MAGRVCVCLSVSQLLNFPTYFATLLKLSLHNQTKERVHLKYKAFNSFHTLLNVRSTLSPRSEQDTLISTQLQCHPNAALTLSTVELSVLCWRFCDNYWRSSCIKL